MKRMMKKSKGVLLMGLLLSALALFTLCGCIDLSLTGIGQRPESGGVTDKTNPRAPKEIKSKEITEFRTNIVLLGEWSYGRENAEYIFNIKNNEEGVLTASEETTGVSFPADEALLTGLQEIIDEQRLAVKNGYYRVTAGLPPEYQQFTFEAVYASGESIKFTSNNNPEAEWAKKIYLLFADWFADKGNDALQPPQTLSRVEWIRVSFTENGLTTYYQGINVKEDQAIDGIRHLFERYVYNNETEQEESEAFILFPEDFYDRVTEILTAHDLRTYDTHSALYGFGRENIEEEEEPYTADIQLYIEFEDGHRMNVESSDPFDKEMLAPFLEDLFAYFDTLFEQ